MTAGQLDLLDDWAAQARGAGHRIPATVTGPDIATYREPSARATDPQTAHAAAERSKPGNGAKIDAIRSYVRTHGASTAWDIAAGVDALYPGRWDLGGIRSACNPKRSGLREYPGGSKVDQAGRVRPVMLYGLPQ